MAYGTANVDVIQSSAANTPVQFNDGNGTQVGTLCRAWINANGASGASPTIRGSFNISSVTRTGAGQYTIAMTNAMPDTNYSVVIGLGYDAVSTGYLGYQKLNGVTKTTTTFYIVTFNLAGSNLDVNELDVSIFR